MGGTVDTRYQKNRKAQKLTGGLAASNVHRCVTSTLSPVKKIILMSGFEVDRYPHKRVTNGLILLSVQIGLKKAVYLDAAASCVVYDGAAPNKEWTVSPHLIGSYWRRK